MINLDAATTPLDIDTYMEEEDADEWQTVLPWTRKRTVLMKLKGTLSGRRESLKGGIVDSDMSGQEVAWALAKLSRGRMHECVSNISPDVVEDLLGCVPNRVTAPTLTSLQQNAGKHFEFSGRGR